MKLTGLVEQAQLSLNGDLLLTLRIKEKSSAIHWLDELIKDKLLSIELKYWRGKRSLNANSYFHVICGKMAEKNNISMTAQKNLLLQEYGQFDTDENGNIPRLLLDDSIDHLEIPWAHLYPTQEVQWANDGRLYRTFYVRRGSHTYDSKEMSTLIEGTVRDAKDLGIETMTPQELERLIKTWKGAGYGDKQTSITGAEDH